MSSLSRNLALRGAACGMALAALATDASAAVITYTDFDAFQAAASTLTTESFETGPWNSIGTKPQGTTNLGVTWTTENELFVGNTRRSGAYGITSLDPQSGDFFDVIQAVLPSDTKAVGGWITTYNQPHGAELQAFDAFDNLLGSVSFGNTGHNFAFLGLTTDTEIAKVRFRSINVVNPIGDDIALDDFSFGSVVPGPIAVQEPAGLALFGCSALAGFAFARRRKPRDGKAAAATLDARLLADIGISRRDALAAAHGIRIDRPDAA